jgi:drug/metabolite transporter, DME family
MTAEPLALVSAFCFAGSHITAKRGMGSTSLIAGLLVQLTAAFLVVLASVAIDPPDELRLGAVTVFAVGGLFAPGLARATTLVGVDRLGPSIAVPIQQGARPVLAVIGAVLLLQESVGPLQVVGVALIAIGGWALSREPGETDLTESVGNGGASRRFKAGIIFPLATAVFYATSDLIVKGGLDEFSDPNFGALIGIAAALFVWASIVGVVPAVRKRMTFGASFPWFAASGVLMAFALIALFSALEQGEVSLVSPIVASQTLVVFVLSVIFLRDVERIGLRVVIAGTATVLGVVLVSG